MDWMARQDLFTVPLHRYAVEVDDPFPDLSERAGARQCKRGRRVPSIRIARTIEVLHFTPLTPTNSSKTIFTPKITGVASSSSRTPSRSRLQTERARVQGNHFEAGSTDCNMLPGAACAHLFALSQPGGRLLLNGQMWSLLPALAPRHAGKEERLKRSSAGPAITNILFP